MIRHHLLLLTSCLVMAFILTVNIEHLQYVNKQLTAKIQLEKTELKYVQKDGMRQRLYNSIGRNFIESIIIEVTGEPDQRKKEIEERFPTIEVVEIYDTLLHGLALKGKMNDLHKLARVDFIKSIYPVQAYATSVQTILSKTDFKTITTPDELNNTSYTGKGVKVAVIDTGIDMNHQDLMENYKGGFDLVDLDDEPMETTKEEGIPTSHGTHVAGIISANGYIKGVAPDAEIFAYRALGPGGVGTSIQVIAAMEQAMKDGVHVMNLSLGNSVNGPDYPTSKAVQEATKRGIAIIVANGNEGPNDWTVGSPATAPSAFSVGAYERLRKEVILYEPISQKKIEVNALSPINPWNLQRDYRIILFKEDETFRDRIVLISQMEQSLIEKIKKAINNGAVAILIKQVDEKAAEPLIDLRSETFDVPVAVISEKNGEWFERQKDDYFYKTIIKDENNFVASFSSRGPVTINWQIKPNVIAPGVNILSTTPNGYDVYSGTSMAAPHVTGAFAVIKEAKPKWTNEQIFAALETTAQKITDNNNELIAPQVQGAGLIRIDRAIGTDLIIENGLLSFGKIDDYIKKTSFNVTFHNVSNNVIDITIEQPKKSKGLNWKIPKSFSIKAKERKTIPITLNIDRLFLNEGLLNGWITVLANNKEIYLPYIFINRTDSYKKVDGFSIRVNSLRPDIYTYELYATEKAKFVQVQLYNPETLIFEGTLLQLKDVEEGMHKGEIKKRNIKNRGYFHSLIIVQLENGEVVNYETPVYLP